MKINFQKIIIVITALTVVLSSIGFTAFADNGGVDHGGGGSAGRRDITIGFFNNFGSWLKGDIDFAEFGDRTGKMLYELTDRGLMSYYYDLWDNIESIVNEYGDDAKDYISKWVSDFFDDYKVLSEKPSFDLNGASAAWRTSPSDSYTLAFSNSYGIIEQRGNEQLLVLYNVYKSVTYKNGVLVSSTDYSPPTMFSATRGSQLLFGTWYYESENGEKADTDDEYVQTEDFNFDEATDDELDELLKKILEALELSNPDLSSIEGLLKAIYNRLGTLDSDDDSASIALLASAINNLTAQNNTQNTALIEKLEEIKKSMTGRGDSEGNSGNDSEGDSGGDSEGDPDGGSTFDPDDFKEFLKDLIPDIDDMTKTEELKYAFMVKFSFAEELKSLINRFISSYENASDKPIIELKFKADGTIVDGLIWGLLGKIGVLNIDLSGDGIYDGFMPTIRALLAAFIYLSYAWNTYRKIPLYISGGGE